MFLYFPLNPLFHCLLFFSLFNSSSFYSVPVDRLQGYSRLRWEYNNLKIAERGFLKFSIREGFQYYVAISKRVYIE